MNFNTLTQNVTDQIEQIIQLPFNQELTQSTLPEYKFLYYLQQDMYYLVEYSKSLAVTGAKLYDPESIEQMYRFAIGAISAERSLHKSYFTNKSSMMKITPSKTCHAYCHFLLNHAYNSDPIISIAAILPCFWVYHIVGKKIASMSVSNNKYQDWIDVYSGADFKASVDAIVNIFEVLVKNIDDILVHKKIKKVFIEAVEYEYAFWDSAYNFRTELEMV